MYQFRVGLVKFARQRICLSVKIVFYFFLVCVLLFGGVGKSKIENREAARYVLVDTSFTGKGGLRSCGWESLGTYHHCRWHVISGLVGLLNG